MFEKKYVFETKRTRLIRFLMNIALSICVLISIVVFIGVYLPLFSNSESDDSNRAFFNKDPDLIAVYTGDSKRIDHALKLANKYKTSKILISGVYSNLSLKNILEAQSSLSPIAENTLVETNRIEIDQVAKNTIENVISTFHFLRENNTFKKILIISNDYHIMRIKMIVEKIKTDKDHFEFYYRGIPTDYKQVRNIKVLYKEVIKYLKATFFLMLWDRESLNTLNIEGP